MVRYRKSSAGHYSNPEWLMLLLSRQHVASSCVRISCDWSGGMGGNMTGILYWISHFSVEATHFKLPISRIFFVCLLLRKKERKKILPLFTLMLFQLRTFFLIPLLCFFFFFFLPILELVYKSRFCHQLKKDEKVIVVFFSHSEFILTIETLFLAILTIFFFFGIASNKVRSVRYKHRITRKSEFWVYIIYIISPQNCEFISCKFTVCLGILRIARQVQVVKYKLHEKKFWEKEILGIKSHNYYFNLFSPHGWNKLP